MKQQWLKKRLLFFGNWSVIVALLTIVVLRAFVFGLYHVPTGSAEPAILVGDRIWGNKLAFTFSSIARGDLVIFDDPEFTGYSQFPLVRWWQKYLGIPIPFLNIKEGPENWVKRVVGVPGDIVEGKVEDGRTVVYRNGRKLEEPYVNPYPLVRVKKKVGLYNDKSALLTALLPSWLQEYEKEVDYSYDPCKRLQEQPFYYLAEGEIMRSHSANKLLLSLPFTPTYMVNNRLYSSVKCIDIFGPLKIPNGKYWVMGDSRKNSRDSRFWGLLDESIIHGKASFIIYSIDGEEVFWFFDMLKNPITFFTKRIRWKRFFTSLNNYQHYLR